MLNTKKLLTKITDGTLLADSLIVLGTDENKTIANGLSSTTFTPPTGYKKTILLTAYPRTTSNITLQGVTADSNIARFYNEGSSWTGSCGAYWICVK